VIHHVYANQSNTGDWLSALGIQRLLGPDPVVEHLCDEPFVDETLAALAELGPHDLVVIGGGGLFMDYFEPFWEGINRLGPRLRYCIWGAGACDMKMSGSRMSGRLLGAVAAKAELCVVRDRLTSDLIVTGDSLDVVPCPSTVVVSERRRAGTGLLHANNYDNVGDEVYQRVRAFLSGEATQRGEIFRETNNRIEAGRPQELQQNLDIYQSSELVVASALHGCIIGLSLGCKVLAISGDRKVESFMEAAGLGDWVLDLTEIDELEGRFADLSNQPSVDEFVADAVTRNSYVAKIVRDLAAEDD
jgi:polysaccharide pyruvyl transferase WcaK-like protein